MKNYDNVENVHYDFGDILVAYYSMEIGFDNEIPTYAGGLGILAGDLLRSFADQKVPVVGVTLLHKKGFFKQKLIDGWQNEEDVNWNPDKKLKSLNKKIQINIENRVVAIQAWVYEIEGIHGNVPIIFLDTDLSENSEYDRSLTDHLYGNDQYYRLCQEMVLGIGGTKMIAELGITPNKYHMNEGHSALLTLELARTLKDKKADEIVEEVRQKCVFTTHTPVKAGHDQFDHDMANRVLGDLIAENSKVKKEIFYENKLNMTYLGLRFSNYINGVAKKHGEISMNMFPGYNIDSITNGVHSAFWICKPIKDLLSQYIEGWECDPFSLRYVLSIPNEDFWDAHITAKKTLFSYIKKHNNIDMDPDVFTIGFARRAATYKRGDMLFENLDKLKKLATNRKIQIVYAGKAHPNDQAGKEIIKNIINKMSQISDQVKACFLENYDIEIAKKLVSGVDVWLNTPIRPKEASGTSGMKAAHNGVPHFSVLDGWWIEGHIENVTGWSIGLDPEDPDEIQKSSPGDKEDLYSKLEYVILPTYYEDPDRWISIMRHTIAINASFFNTHRMAQQYVMNAYFK